MLVLRSYTWLHGCHLTTGGLVGLGGLYDNCPFWVSGRGNEYRKYFICDRTGFRPSTSGSSVAWPTRESEKEKRHDGERINSQITSPAPAANTVGSCTTIIQTQHWNYPASSPKLITSSSNESADFFKFVDRSNEEKWKDFQTDHEVRHEDKNERNWIGWLLFRFNGPLRQYFSLYRAVPQRKEERREKIGGRKMSEPPQPQLLHVQ